jgi:hypothetical protein
MTGKHNVRVKALSEKIALALGNAVVAPVVAYVPEGNLSPPTRTCASLARSRSRTQRSKNPRVRCAVSACTASAISFCSEITVDIRRTKAVADKLNREWSGVAVRVHAVEEYYRSTQTRATYEP